MEVTAGGGLTDPTATGQRCTGATSISECSTSSICVVHAANIIPPADRVSRYGLEHQGIPSGVSMQKGPPFCLVF